MNVSMKHLEFLALRINRLTGSPEKPWERVDGKLQSNVGNYHIEQFNGGYQLVRMDNEGGGVYSVSEYASSKAILAQFMKGMIAGLEWGKS